MVACQGNTASNIIRGMHKDETIDIYEKLPANIVLLSYSPTSLGGL